jgi:GNAT superfamily N-acetyltransferase
MDIRDVDVNDDEDFRGFYDAMRVAELHERPDMPMWSEHDAQVVFRHGDPTETMTGYVAVDHDRVLGAGILTVIHNSNVDKAFLEVLVRPEHRGRGVGTALEAHLAGLAADLGRTNLIIESHIPADRREDHPHRRFAERCGYALANVEIKRFLALPVSNESLDRWQAEADPHHQRYRIETYLNDIPDELLESYCDLQGQLALEAPTGDLDFEAEVVTIEAFRARQAKNAERGLMMYATVAIDHTGEVVAHSVRLPVLDTGAARSSRTPTRDGDQGPKPARDAGSTPRASQDCDAER